MSRAFTKEDAPDAPVILADRQGSNEPNYVTVSGFRAIEDQLQKLRTEFAAQVDNETVTANTRLAELRRDVRYLTLRLESADIVEPSRSEVVRFGHVVTFEDGARERYQFQIVGEDEADIKLSKLSWTAPLARALIGKRVGDLLIWQKSDSEIPIEILYIDCLGKQAQNL